MQVVPERSDGRLIGPRSESGVTKLVVSAPESQQAIGADEDVRVGDAVERERKPYWNRRARVDAPPDRGNLSASRADFLEASCNNIALVGSASDERPQR